MLFAMVQAEVAIYEALALAAQTAGDSTTQALAVAIGDRKKAAAERVWPQVAPVAEESIGTMPYATAR